MSKRLAIEVEGVEFAFELVGVTLTFRRGESPPVTFGPDSSVQLDALLVLFNEVLALGADLDETEKAFRREEERAGNMAIAWGKDIAIREREFRELDHRADLARTRADDTLVQLERERAKRAEISGVQPCLECASEYTAPIFARSEGRPGVIAVCCDCGHFAPWREIEPT